MINRILFCTLLILTVCCLHAQQDTLLLTKNFKFKDGIYLTLQDFQHNNPTYTWGDVQASMATSDEGFIAQVEFIKLKEQQLDLQQVWGICIAGIPYVRLAKGKVTNAATVFAGLRVRGKICYFNYKEAVTVMQMVKAYNPLTGRPFRQGKIPVEKMVERHQLLHFQTGQVVDFTKNNFMTWIADDRQLLETVQDLSPQEVQEKLFKCLLIYVDRNEIYLK